MKENKDKEKKIGNLLRKELKSEDISYIFVTPHYSNFNGSMIDLLSLLSCLANCFKDCEVPHSFVRTAVEIGYGSGDTESEMDNVLKQFAEILKDLEDRSNGRETD